MGALLLFAKLNEAGSSHASTSDTHFLAQKRIWPRSR
jgi:hypothetical protein